MITVAFSYPQTTSYSSEVLCIHLHLSLSLPYTYSSCLDKYEFNGYIIYTGFVKYMFSNQKLYLIILKAKTNIIRVNLSLFIKKKKKKLN